MRVGAVSQHLLKQGDGLVHLPELCFCLVELGVEQGVEGGEDPGPREKTPKRPPKAEGQSWKVR